MTTFGAQQFRASSLAAGEAGTGVCANRALDRHLVLQPLDLVVGYAGHALSSKILVISFA
jgi:hypothetical protein